MAHVLPLQLSCKANSKAVIYFFRNCQQLADLIFTIFASYFGALFKTSVYILKIINVLDIALQTFLSLIIVKTCIFLFCPKTLGSTMTTTTPRDNVGLVRGAAVRIYGNTHGVVFNNQSN